MERITALEMATAYVNFMTYGYYIGYLQILNAYRFVWKIDRFFLAEILLHR